MSFNHLIYSEHFTTWTGIQGDSVADFNSSFILDYAVVAPQGTSIAHSVQTQFQM
jgi:hypothetical protein